MKTMKNGFEMSPILAEGSIVKEKDQEELFELGEYDADKKGYNVFPFEDGVRFDDFTMVISENELMDNYLIETKMRSDDDGNPMYLHIC